MAAASFTDLRAIVKKHKFEEPSTARALGEFTLFVVMALGGVGVTLGVDNLLVQAVAMFISTCGCLGISTAAHTASHYAACKSHTLNDFLTYFGFTFFFGVSGTYWWNKHCIIHHPSPNLVGLDDDIDLAPFFAVTDHQFGKGPMRRLHRLQALVVPFAISLNVFNVQRQGWMLLASRMSDRRTRKAGHWIDVAFIASHWIVWVFLPMLFLAPSVAVGLYVLRMALMGYAMFVAFAPAHFPPEAAAADASARSADFLLRQTATSVNFRTGWFGSLLCGGVQYQIEHHLFCSMPPHCYPELSKIVSAFCFQHGYPYRTIGWWEGVWKSLLVFWRPKRVLPDLETCMESAASSGVSRASSA